MEGRTWVWTYDDAGNILSRAEHAYTTGTLGNPLGTVVYTYGDSAWGDLLTSYDGKAITYDGVGNPLTYGNITYTWEHGRELASLSDSTTTWAYTYDANGMRTSRSNGSSLGDGGNEQLYLSQKRRWALRPPAHFSKPFFFDQVFCFLNLIEITIDMILYFYNIKLDMEAETIK